MNEELLTVEETSKILKCSKIKVYNLIKAGLIPALKLGHTKIRRTAVDKFILDNENKDLSNLDNIKELGADNDKKI